MEDLDSRVVDLYHRLSRTVLQLIADTPEESFASFYSLDPEAQISYLGTLEVLARQLVRGFTRQAQQSLALESPSGSGTLVATGRRQQPSLQVLYEGFRELNPNFLGELLNLARGGTATLRGSTPEGLSQTLTITGGLQSLLGEGFLALTAPQQPTVRRGSSLALLPPSQGITVSRPLTGPVTLPRGLGPVLSAAGGLSSRLRVSRFTQAALDLQTEWGGLSPGERAQRIVAAANRELGVLGIPPCGSALVKKSNVGEFSHTTWVMELQETLFKKDDISREELAELGDTAYHEARHAEQFFQIVRYLAATGKSQKAIEEETGLPSGVVALGCLNPLPIPESGYSKEMAEAMEWHESIFGKKALERQESLRTYREIKQETFLLSLDLEEKVDDFKKRKRRVTRGNKLLKEVAARFLRARERFKSFSDCLNTTKEQFRKQQIRQSFKPTLLDLMREHKEIQKLLIDCQQRWQGLNHESSLAVQACQDKWESIKELRIQLTEYENVLEIFYQEYRALPEERDAWDVGSLVSQTLLSLIPEISEIDQLEQELLKMGFEIGSELGEDVEGVDEPLPELELNLPEEEVVEPHPFDGPVAEIEGILRNLLIRLQTGIATLTPLPDEDTEL